MLGPLSRFRFERLLPGFHEAFFQNSLAEIRREVKKFPQWRIVKPGPQNFKSLEVPEMSAIGVQSCPDLE